VIWYLTIGAMAVFGLALALVTILDDVAENHTGAGVVPYDSPTGWWPDADQPVGLQLTDRGQLAVELPEVFLDEDAETWGPA
jgi:hypothetical protein